MNPGNIERHWADHSYRLLPANILPRLGDYPYTLPRTAAVTPVIWLPDPMEGSRADHPFPHTLRKTLPSEPECTLITEIKKASNLPRTLPQYLS